MAAPTRSSITRGGGILTFDSQTWIDKDGINADAVIEKKEDEGSDFGTIDTYATDKRMEVGLTPIGRLDADRLTSIYGSYKNPTKGMSIFGSSDSAIAIQSRAGKLLTITNGAITGLPDLTLGADRTALGAMALTGLLKNGGDWTDADALYTLADNAYSEPTIDRTEIKRVAYTGAWGTTYTGMIAKDAWTISFDLQLEDDKVADYGTIDKLFQNLTVTAKCRPMGLSETMLDNMRLQGTGAAIGASLSQSNNLVITGTGGLTVTLYDAMFIEGPIVYNGVELRAGEIAFQASRTNGVGQIFDVAMTA